MITDREALRQIESLLEKFLNRGVGWGEPDESLISNALDIVVTVLARESVENTRISELSWHTNPDRSGGQFTASETRNSGHWI